MPKHTPWNQELGDGLFIISNSVGELVAKAVGQSREDDEANAHLIAAAPEMLEALKAVMSRIKAAGGKGARVKLILLQLLSTKADVENAIAKAEGHNA